MLHEARLKLHAASLKLRFGSSTERRSAIGGGIYCVHAPLGALMSNAETVQGRGLLMVTNFRDGAYLMLLKGGVREKIVNGRREMSSNGWGGRKMGL